MNLRASNQPSMGQLHVQTAQSSDSEVPSFAEQKQVAPQAELESPRGAQEHLGYRLAMRETFSRLPGSSIAARRSCRSGKRQCSGYGDRLGGGGRRASTGEPGRWAPAKTDHDPWAEHRGAA